MELEGDSVRIGHAERDEAVRLLQRQVAEGRLARIELDERARRVRAARTRADLEPIFADLPVDLPTGEGFRSYESATSASPTGFAPYQPTNTFQSYQPPGQPDSYSVQQVPVEGRSDWSHSGFGPVHRQRRRRSSLASGIVMLVVWGFIMFMMFRTNASFWWIGLVILVPMILRMVNRFRRDR